MPIPLLLLAAAAVVAASGDDDDSPPPPPPLWGATVKYPVWQATPVFPATTVADEPPEEKDLGPPIYINKVIVADFVPKPGEYGEAEMPEQCAPIINWCTPSIKLPLGFPDGHIPAKPLLVELAQADGPMLLWGVVETRARTSGGSSNEVWQGDLSRFQAPCLSVGYIGEAGTTQTSDVPVSNVDGGGSTANAYCALAQSPSIPRLTVVKTGGSRRLMLYVPAHKGSVLRIQVTLMYRVVR